MAEETKETFVDVDDIRSNYGKITDEEIQKMVNRQKRVVPIVEGCISSVNNDNLKRMARGTGDWNKLYYDAEYAKTTRYGKRIAPPSFYYGVFWGAWDMRHGQGFPGVHGFHCGDHWVFYKPLYEGDTCSALKQEWALWEMQGRWAGRQMMQIAFMKFIDDKGEMVAKDYFPIIRGERGEAKKRDKNIKAIKELGHYTQEENAEFDRITLAQENGGDNGRYWENVNVGDETYTYLRGPLTVADMICWLQAVNSPHCRTGLDWVEYRKWSPSIAIPDPESGVLEAVERVHWDSFMAREIGDPAAYDYGSMRGGFATMFAANWIGDNGWLAECEFQFRGFNFIHDVTKIKGTVVSKWVGKVSGTHYVDVKFSSINQRGEDAMPGWFTAALPTKDKALVFPIDAEADRPDDLPLITELYGIKAKANAKAKGQLHE